MEENLASQDAAGEIRPASASQPTPSPAPSAAESEATVLYEGRESGTSSPADTPVAVNAEEVIASPALTSELEESPTLLATGHPADTPAATQPGEEQAEPPTLIMPLEPHPEGAALPTAHTQDEQLPVAPAPYTLDPSAASQPVYMAGTPQPPGFYPQMLLPPQARAPRKPLPWKKILPLAVAILILLAGGSFGIWYLVTPHPTLSMVSSTQKTAVLPAGVSIQGVYGPIGTVLHISGSDYSHNSVISILLDGAPYPLPGKLVSDGSGNFQFDLTITADWGIRAHTLNARDASGYKLQDGTRVTVIPAPMLQLISQYNQSGTPAGSTGTSLQVSGQQFTPGSQVVFLLDGRTFSSLGSVTSDASGSFSRSVTLDSSWAVGSHTLTAKDARNYVTHQSYPLAIVQQGDADTPGPNGSPANDSSFSLSLTETISGQSYLTLLDVTGHPDPAGGTVCGPLDDGQPHSYSGSTSDGTSYTVKLTQKCSGTYKYGHLTYTETMVSEQIVFPGLGTCTAATPYVAEKITGSYVSGGIFKGTVHSGSYTMNCAGSIASQPAADGTVTSA